jgi:hypothetical protein
MVTSQLDSRSMMWRTGSTYVGTPRLETRVISAVLDEDDG